MSLPMKNNRLAKHCAVMLFLLSGILFPVGSMAQVLFANEDNIVTIKVPGINSSKVTATAKGGTLVRKKGTDQWIAQPTGEKDTNGVRKDFVITVSVNINGKNEVWASKAYGVKTVYIIDYFDETTHRIKKDELKESDTVLLKADGIKKICFRVSGSDSMGNTLTEPNCDFLFSDKEKRYLDAYSNTKINVGGRRLYLSVVEAWRVSGEKISLPPIELTFGE